MPEKTEKIQLEGYDTPSVQALAMGACEKLGWNVKYAVQHILVAYTPRSWNKWDMEISIEAGEGELTITSKMIHDELMDALGRNQKNLDSFFDALKEVKPALNETTKEAWLEKINALQQHTLQAAEEEVKQQEETDQVMNFSKSNLFLTYGIIAVNLIVFVLMAIDGAGLFFPEDGTVHVRWGSNYTPFTLSGDWWRLITSQYLHFGLIHLLLNMYALLNLGSFLEPMMGKLRYFLAYTCSGVFAGLLSLLWHTDGVNSAGASGAIFGLIGLLFAFILTKYIPSTIRKGLLQSVGVMAAYSLIYGMKGGIDNAAHIGGLIGGFVIGLLFWLSMRKEGEALPTPLITAVVLAITAGAAYVVLQNKPVSQAERQQTKAELKNAGYKDYTAFANKYAAFASLENEALELIRKDSVTADYFTEQKNSVSVPAWEKAEQLLQDMEQMNISEEDLEKVKLLKQYVALRKTELDAREAYLKNPEPAAAEKIRTVNDSLVVMLRKFSAGQSSE